MNNKIKVAIVVSAVMGVLISTVIAFAFRTFTVPVSEYIDDKSSKTVNIEYNGAGFQIHLSSLEDNMKVEVVADGKIVFNSIFEMSNFDFSHSMKLGRHYVTIYLENPAIFGWGKTIFVSGTVYVDRF